SSSVRFGIAYSSLPQGSLLTGTYFSTLSAWALKRAGLMKFPGKGWPVEVSISGRLRQAADSAALKSPLSVAAVGTKTVFVCGAVRMLVAWNPAKKKSLFLRTGPPNVPPAWFLFNASRVGAKKFLALVAPLRRNQNTLPWYSLLPDFVTRLTTAPAPKP